jgi:hypothetical protein
MANRRHFVEIKVTRGHEVSGALNHYAADGYVIEATIGDRIIMSKKIKEKKLGKAKDQDRDASETREGGGDPAK